MVKCFLSLGIINNKLIIPFSLFFLSIIHILYINYVLENKANVIVTELSASIGHLLIIIIPYIKCISTHQDKRFKTNSKKKNYVLDYSIFFLTHFLNLILLYASAQLKPQEDHNSSILFMASDVHGLYCITTIEVIFTIIFSFFLLDFHFYIHHYLSLFLFIIISIVIDYMLDNFHYKLDRQFLFYLIAFISQLLVESINLSYQKYMFDVLYYSPYRTCFAFGILFLLYNLGTIVVFLIIHNYEFLRYFDNISIGQEITKFLTNIIMVFFLFMTMALTNYYFSPNHIIVSYELGNMLSFLIKSFSHIKYYTIFLFVFQIILLMIFLELLELNFCKLNENTKKNIQKRADKDMADMAKYDSILELESGYLIDERDTKKDLN